ncbi:cytochrome B [Izhakiella australiensis]|uniref:Cytochrome B n=1 Tax=Izhakiella australiensis TaxID=1926881 RepID=A0A1S8YRX2_9GAMM|nr:cytochrome b/b6 domain-containing protein [Izhakiella australiensis]OON41889.1 cytochrome B [Izhakiella australiensis]
MKSKYSKPQVFLHWLSAIIIIWATISGFWAAFGDLSPASKDWIGFFNVSLTTLFIPFFIIRLFYAFFSAKPNDDLLTHKEEILAFIGHFLLYVNITVVMVTGVLMMERPINVFNWFTLPQPLTNLQLTSLFNFIHMISCTTLALLVIGHILAVIKHQLQGKALLRRMGW